MLEVIRISLKQLLIPQFILFQVCFLCCCVGVFFGDGKGIGFLCFMFSAQRIRKINIRRKNKSLYKLLKLSQVSHLIHPERWYSGGGGMWICIYFILRLFNKPVNPLPLLVTPPSISDGRGISVLMQKWMLLVCVKWHLLSLRSLFLFHNLHQVLFWDIYDFLSLHAVLL